MFSTSILLFFLYTVETGVSILSNDILIQSNFNGSNTFGTMKISSRQGKFEPVRVDNCARSGGIIRIFLTFYNDGMLCVLIRIASLRRF